MTTKRQFKEFCIENGASPSIVHTLISSREFVDDQKEFRRAAFSTLSSDEDPAIRAQQMSALSEQREAAAKIIKPEAANSDIRTAAIIAYNHRG